MQLAHKPIILIVLDGWGYSENAECNAIAAADKPVWDRLWRDYPHTLINASGTNVGLPGEQMGNSEVGHMNIGSGRVIKQEFTRISDAIADGSFFTNPVLEPACKDAARGGHALHVLGLLSPGGVHSHQQHIYALLDLAQRCGLREVYLHAFLDGRDTPPRSARDYIAEAAATIQARGWGRIASLVGRYYAMDRNQNWDRVRYAYDLITGGEAGHREPDPVAAIEAAYARGESDEFVKPVAITDGGGNPVTVRDGDLVIFANFRADRARQLSRAFTEREFDGFPRSRVPRLAGFISMTRYHEEFTFPAAFPPAANTNVLGEILSRNGLRQLRIAETEKYAHVTFFFNGGEEQVFENEDRILVPSPAVATYDMKPEMSAYEVTDKMVAAIGDGGYDAIIANFANADMVGHTGDFAAAKASIEAIDTCLGRIVEAALATGGEVIITADHGNAEQMRSAPDGRGATQPHTAHTSNPVPLLYIGRPADMLPGSGALCDIAPTLLTLMDIPQPAEMTGRSLLRLRPHAGRALGG